MAKRVLLVDDISGDIIDEGLGGTVEFSFEGKDYEVDLGVKNTDAFRKALEPYIKVAREAEPLYKPQRTSAPKRRTAGSASSDMSKEQREAIRTWANKNGYSVGDRGRIKADIVKAFEDAHQQEPAESNT